MCCHPEPFGIVILSGAKDLAFDASGIISATPAQRIAGGEESRSGQAQQRVSYYKKEILHGVYPFVILRARLNQQEHSHAGAWERAGRVGIAHQKHLQL
jgi:hypothetical protein